MACKKGTVELCSIADDANALFRRMAAADLILIAAPVFFSRAAKKAHRQIPPKVFLHTELSSFVGGDYERSKWAG